MATYNDYIEYLKHVDNTTREEIDKQIDSLGEEISALKTSLTTLQKEKDLLSAQLAKSQKDLLGREDMLNMKSVEVDKLIKTKKDLADKLLLLQQERDSLSGSLEKVKQDLLRKIKEVEDSEIRSTDLRIQLDEKIKDLQAQNNGLRQRYLLSEKSVSEKEEVTRKLDTQLRQAYELTKHLEEQIAYLSNENSELKEKIDAGENKNAIGLLSSAFPCSAALRYHFTAFV